MKSLLSWLAAGLALAAPASAHLLTRGIPLSELAASSPVAVIGRVESAASTPQVSRSEPKASEVHATGVVTLAVESAVLGSVPPGPLRFSPEGHHPPDYAVGSRVLVFLKTSAPPWVSRQTALDLVEIPERAAARDALLSAVRGYAGLRGVRDPAERIAQLKTFALANLESASDRVRHESLLDLLALAPAKPYDAADVARVAALAREPKTPETLAPGLVVLLAAIRIPESEPALVAVLQSAASPQTRAAAARVLGKRRGPIAVAALHAAQRDRALAVRLTAQRALDGVREP